MLFNSLDFAIFLPIVFILYWFVTNRNLKLQNLLIVAASYVFYGWWDWRFLILIILSSVIDFVAGINIANAKTEKKRKLFLSLSMLTNLGLLGFFKYFNFFIDNFTQVFSFFGHPISASSLDIVLPVGISFYTFQTMSYTIDVYRWQLEPTRDFIAFSAFVSFFPQLVAGPIERATHLLPQFYKKRTFDYEFAKDGIRQMLWGFFKKVVIADNCAHFANIVFNDYGDYGGTTLAVGAVLFAFQIYGDFSGYSDIAIGLSKLFGFDLMRNFAYPYFSRDIAEFWRRWHISLSTWFRDYLYIPLGGSRGGNWMRIRNTFIIFLVSGFWHGANWTFIVWGALNAFYILPSIVLKTNRKNLDIVAENTLLPNFREFLQMGITFSLAVLAWIFFRAPNVSTAVDYIKSMFVKWNVGIGYPMKLLSGSYFILFFLAIMLLAEWLMRTREHPFQFARMKIPLWTRWCIYVFFTLSILWYAGDQEDFIYFQF
ncbi:MBOAT family O-acyltransferase [Riemerella columbina]|uniref:MBOAT family O-acyltransferase n=1 Tax=Riemerella columbina TaxID=103810 RepID=UPI00266FDE0C|nr:MBOAT family O-acyltransferase [Riemerella columbina]WKS95146.1 MBOAT family protein [Riemerella columbina]